MNIGPHTFSEFKEIARQFHGYPAPGLLIGGYMVEMAKARIPEGTLFEAVVETGKCLPDAVQLLTLCSLGNGWMKIANLGRYALSLYDKHTGDGFRVWIDSNKLHAWPEIEAWFLKKKAKQDQDTERLFAEIEAAGEAICSLAPVQVADFLLGKSSMGSIALCPVCTEAYPARDGAICRGCQGDAPYRGWERQGVTGPCPPLRTIAVKDAVGTKALHDMTRIEPGRSKGPEFKAGQVIGAGDVCRLQQMGKHRLFVESDLPEGEWVHENEAVLAFALRMAGPGIGYDPDPHEGKIDFTATCDGLFVLDRQKLAAFNLVPNVMCATRQGDLVVAAGKKLAGSRAIPLYLSRADFSRALAALNGDPLFSVLPLRKARVGILVTGTEVFQGLIEDRFIPIISAKVEGLGSSVAATDIVPDDREAIAASAQAMLDQGCDLIVTTAGLSVDPDDVTRAALKDAGLRGDFYGAPVLPGTMTLVGRMGEADVLGVPACALFFKTTSLDLLLPRLLAGQQLTRRDLAHLAEGGFCLGCKACTFPKCPFGK
ncbi:MAG: trehalose-binding protein [Proteobacteria bacterium]|nr:trehalose-binding protein [Pseudomonadota bacterium]